MIDPHIANPDLLQPNKTEKIEAMKNKTESKNKLPPGTLGDLLTEMGVDKKARCDEAWTVWESHSGITRSEHEQREKALAFVREAASSLAYFESCGERLSRVEQQELLGKATIIVALEEADTAKEEK